MLIVAHIVGLRAVEDESFPMLPVASTTSISSHAAMLMTNSATAAGGGGGSGNNARDHRAGSVTSLTSNDSLHESIATNNSNHNNTESISAAKLLFQDCAQGDDDKPVRARRIEYKPPPQVTHLTLSIIYTL